MQSLTCFAIAFRILSVGSTALCRSATKRATARRAASFPIPRSSSYTFLSSSMVSFTASPSSRQLVPERDAKPARVLVSAAAVLLGYLGNVHAFLGASQTEHAAVRRVPIATGERLVAGEQVAGIAGK